MSQLKTNSFDPDALGIITRFDEALRAAREPQTTDERRTVLAQRAEIYRERAEQLRALAYALSGENPRALFLELVAEYERMADEAGVAANAGVIRTLSRP